MTTQPHQATPTNIGNKLQNILFPQPLKEGVTKYKKNIFKSFFALVALPVMVAFFAVSPFAAHAQDASRESAAYEVGSEDLIYATMGPSGSIAVIDLAARTVIDSIDAGGNLHGGALTPDGNYLYTSNMSGEWISVVDTRTGKVVTKINLGAGSHHAAVRPDGRYVYEAAGRLKVIDSSTNEVATEIDTGEFAFYPLVDPNGRTLYVLNRGTTISVIDTQTNTVTNTIKMGAKSMMGHLALSPDGKTLYATSDTENVLSIIDIESGQRRARVAVGQRPHGVAVSSDGSRVFVSNREGNTISVVDAKTATVIKTLPLNGRPVHLAIVSGGDYLLAGLMGRFQEVKSDRTNAIAMIDPQSLEIIEEIPLWAQVHDILVTQTQTER
ncbi:MAG: beta-propeller fold lactonase family protein [Gracilimonas sp.]|uniref:cytochrome D1 domain-containing protein n=1 Tax=Gracilimonas sp. TaxID=1974203 RepID=UPI003753B2F5|nr:beta-propeller fold lactonase family protein [Gracilimonas sp.]